VSLGPSDGEPLLTGPERKAVRLAGELYALIRDEVCGHSATRDADLAEVCADIRRTFRRGPRPSGRGGIRSPAKPG
jgi:hypothetical protein